MVGVYDVMMSVTTLELRICLFTIRLSFCTTERIHHRTIKSFFVLSTRVLGTHITTIKKDA
jgi:hypothetical protein